MTSLPGTAFILQLYSALKVPVYALLEVQLVIVYVNLSLQTISFAAKKS